MSPIDPKHPQGAPANVQNLANVVLPLPSRRIPLGERLLRVLPRRRDLQNYRSVPPPPLPEHPALYIGSAGQHRFDEEKALRLRSPGPVDEGGGAESRALIGSEDGVLGGELED